MRSMRKVNREHDYGEVGSADGWHQSPQIGLRIIKALRWIPPSSLGGGKRRFAEGESACCSY